MKKQHPGSSNLTLNQGEYPKGEGVGVPKQPTMASAIVAALLEFYQPTGEPETMELKTTADLMGEMDAIADISKNEISNALQHAGFKLKYTSSGVFWVLYTVNLKW